MIRSDSLSHTAFKFKDKLDLLLSVCSECENSYQDWYPELGEKIRYWWALEYIFISNDKVPSSFKKEKWAMLFEENLLKDYKKHSKGFLSSPYNFIYKFLYIKLSLRLFFYKPNKSK
jgi:Fe-S oxidoreductase